VRKLSAATVSEIAALPGFGQRTAESVYAALHQDAQHEQAQHEQAQHQDAQHQDAQLTGGKT
jgi:Holliday junction resolvasome RuvABC DNA-binding subunit